jgi:hypothetical protein
VTRHGVWIDNWTCWPSSSILKDKVKKKVAPDCYAPSLEPFRIYRSSLAVTRLRLTTVKILLLLCLYHGWLATISQLSAATSGITNHLCLLTDSHYITLAWTGQKTPLPAVSIAGCYLVMAHLLIKLLSHNKQHLNNDVTVFCKS